MRPFTNWNRVTGLLLLAAGCLAGILPTAAQAQRVCRCDRGPATLLRWNGCCPPSEPGDEEDTIVTDRPDFTEASSTVGLGRVQLEIGYTFSEDREGNASSTVHSYPEPLLRIGMFRDWFEFRLAWNIADVTQRIGGVRQTVVGAEDLQLGTKLALTPQCGILPEMGLIFQMNVPTGIGEFSSDDVQPGVNWLYSWELSDYVAVGGSTQGNRRVDGLGHDYTEWAQSMTVGIQLTERWGAFNEWFAFFPHSATDPSVQVEHYYNGGFTWLLNNNLQYDVRAGLGLNDEAVDYFVGTGLSVRF